MKLAAIARRGIRRDFWDLYVLCQGTLTLAEALDAYLARFGKVASDGYHVVRALTYFDDAEREPVSPAGMTDRLWEKIKESFRRAAPRLVLDDDPP